MKFDLNNIVRKEVLNLAPYIAGVPSSNHLRLHANESSRTPDTNRDQKNNPVNRYFGIAKILEDLICKIFRIDRHEFLVTRGSSEGVDIITRTFCDPQKDSILISTPTFDMYRYYAEILGVNVIDIPQFESQDTFIFPTGAVSEKIKENSNIKVLYLCTPNNPTGNSISREDIALLCKLMMPQGIVVVDEAYIEFSSSPSMIQFIKEIPNLILLRTMSKAYALAGVRAGFIFSNEDIINYCSRVVPPYSCPITTQEQIILALEDANIIESRKYIDLVKIQKNATIASLRKNKLISNIYYSDGNFILCRFKNAEIVLNFLKENDLLIRGFPNMKSLKQCLRITIGKADEMEQLVDLLKQLESKV